jgi:Domain of unknown function (DUF4158)
MASIERTAYPRFTSLLSAQELHTLYYPTDEERRFVIDQAREAASQLTLLTLLKCQQHLGYMPPITAVPQQIQIYLCQQLHCPPPTELGAEAARTLSRHRHLVRVFLDITPYPQGGAQVVERVVEQAAYTMSDPADLINVAIEHLVQQRFELPTFPTLDRLVGHVRHRVHQALYTRITAPLSPNEQERLDALLQVREGRTDFTRIKDNPRGASLKQMRRWSDRLAWLEALFAAGPLLKGIAKTKLRQFAAEASVLDVTDMRRMDSARRYSLLICLLYQAQVQTRDQLIEMFLKRMRRMLAAAKEQLRLLQQQHRDMEEYMMAAFAVVVEQAARTPDDTTLGQDVRRILTAYGGAEALQEHYQQVSAYHHNNYRPLLWARYRPYRAALFRLTRLLTFRSATQNQSLIEALHCIQRYQHARQDHVPSEIALDFASIRWQALVKTRPKMVTVLNRRHLEVCVFRYLQ